MKSSVDNENKKKYILISPTDSLDDTTLTAQKEYSINFTAQKNECCLGLHYNGVNSFVFINDVELYKFKAKDSELNAAPLSLGNGSNNFSVDNMKKTELYRYFDVLSVDFESTDVDILDIRRYSMKKHNIK